MLQEHLGHTHEDELVHFDFDVATQASAFSLVDANGRKLTTQVESLSRSGSGHARGRIWSVVSLAPRTRLELTLWADAGKRSGGDTAATDRSQTVRVVAEEGELIVENDRIAIALPRWQTSTRSASDLSDLPGPLRALRRAGGAWLGASRWMTGGAKRPLPIVHAETEVIERGPVRATVRQAFRLADGRTYQATFSLTARQDAVMVVEHGNVDEPSAALRVSVAAGLQADHVYWHNQWAGAASSEAWQLFDSEVSFASEQTLFALRPWSFWWKPHLSEWAGFYRQGGDALLGVIMLRPERWAPYHWGGFDRTEVAVTARPPHDIDLTFPLIAGAAIPAAPQPSVLHREWAITVGERAPFVTKDASRSRLRRLLIKHGEFSLDELESYGFEWAERALDAGETRESLVFDRDALQRARSQAKSEPSVALRAEKAMNYLAGCGGLTETLKSKGASGFYERYVQHQLQEALPQAYLGSPNDEYGAFMTAAVKGLAQEVVQTFLLSPSKPALGAYGPWFSETVTRLLLHYELIRGSGLLSRAEELDVLRALVFGAQVLAHPSYWNPDRGLASANPNMSASILFARGALGLALRGHPASAGWARDAQASVDAQLSNWVTPGGAWIENPFYQLRSLDMIFLLAHMTRRAGGRDFFADPRLRDTLSYLGFLLTPPDPRFRSASGAALMTLPTVGHSFVGTVSPFHGWMAAETRQSDPEFSAQQQFFWLGQGRALENAERLKGVASALTDPELPAAAPAESSRAFEGFGSVMRSSWTDSKASYLLHRTGPNRHHYDMDQGSLVYYAKGAPLCPDWGNLYQPVARSEPAYQNLVSVEGVDESKSETFVGRLVAFQSLPSFIDYSHGESWLGGSERTVNRRALLIKSNDALGANYAMVRDVTKSSSAETPFSWNLWCLSREPSINNNTVHFPGQFGVDLDAHVLSPRVARIERDRWSWKQFVPVWGDHSEEQHAMKIKKSGSNEDFFVLLHPRAAGQRRARVVSLAHGAGARVEHEEGTDYLLLAPGPSDAVLTDGLARLSGQVAFARRYRTGLRRLAVLRGRAGASASLDGWALRSDGSVAIEVRPKKVIGESRGDAQTMRLELPRGERVKRLLLDGQDLASSGRAGMVELALPAGAHRLELDM